MAAYKHWSRRIGGKRSWKTVLNGEYQCVSVWRVAVWLGGSESREPLGAEARGGGREDGGLRGWRRYQQRTRWMWSRLVWAVCIRTLCDALCWLHFTTQKQQIYTVHTDTVSDYAYVTRRHHTAALVRFLRCWVIFAGLNIFLPSVS